MRRRPQRPAAGSMKTETPKEAAARRKREAADRKAEELKVAAKASLKNVHVARRMKEEHLRIGSSHHAVTADSFGPGKTGLLMQAPSAASTATDGHSSYSDDQEEEFEQPLTEISEASSSVEEYEDDFEDDFGSEEEDDFEVPEADGVPAMSNVREEQDITRVMTNYEKDLARGPEAATPPARRTNDRAPAVAPAGAVMDMRSRATKMREDLMAKMGPDLFHTAFDFLFKARHNGDNDKQVRRDLEQLVGRENYKLYCFEVDQLVFQELYQ